MKVLGKEVPLVNGMYDLNFIAFVMGLEEEQSPQVWASNLPGFSAAALRLTPERVYANEEYTELYLDWLLPVVLDADARRIQLLNGGVLETLGVIRGGNVGSVEVIWIGDVALSPKNGLYQLSRVQYGMQRKANLSVHSFAERLPGQHKPYVKVELRKECYWGNKAAVYEYLAQGYPEMQAALVMTGSILRKAIPNELTNKLAIISLWQ